MNESCALLTGSQIYGTPHEKSDVDVVILLDPNDAVVLLTLMDVKPERDDKHYPNAQFKAGKLNVIVESNPDAFAVWKRGTSLLIEQAPVTREVAVALFKKLRALSQAGGSKPTPMEQINDVMNTGPRPLGEAHYNPALYYDTLKPTSQNVSHIICPEHGWVGTIHEAEAPACTIQMEPGKPCGKPCAIEEQGHENESRPDRSAGTLEAKP